MSKNENKMRESFIFYRSWADAISTLSDKEQLQIYRAIIDYALDGEEPNIDKMSRTSRAMWALIKPQIYNNIKRYEDGCRGGAPKGNANAQKSTDKKQPKNNHRLILENNQKQPNDNDNDNDNDNECVNSAPAPTREEIYLKNQFDLFPAWCKDNAPSILDFEEPLTYEQFAELFKQYGAPRFMQCAREIHNKKAVASNRNAMTTFSGWIKKINLAS